MKLSFYIRAVIFGSLVFLLRFALSGILVEIVHMDNLGPVFAVITTLAVIVLVYIGTRWGMHISTMKEAIFVSVLWVLISFLGDTLALPIYASATPQAHITFGYMMASPLIWIRNVFVLVPTVFLGKQKN